MCVNLTSESAGIGADLRSEGACVGTDLGSEDACIRGVLRYKDKHVLCVHQ